MSPTRMRLWAGLLLLAGLAVALAPPADPVDPAVVGALPRAGSAATPRAADAVPDLLRILPRQVDPDAEAGRLWRVDAAPAPAAPNVPAPTPPPPVAPALPAAPAAAIAPALPLRTLGRYADGQRVGVILQAADGQVLIAHAGDMLLGTYRVDTLAGNTMVLTYLPLNLRQTLDIGITP